MISFNEFCSKTAGVIRKNYDYKLDVDLQEFYKINTNYMGLVIRKENVNISPAINLNMMYDYYRNGSSYSEIINKIHEIYDNYQMSGNVNVEFLKDLYHVSDLIVFRLINYENNKEMLKDRPYRRLLDMALVYYYEFDLQEIEHCSVCVTNSQMNVWGISEKDLFTLAFNNTPIIHKPLWFDLKDYIKSMMSQEAVNMMGDINELFKIYVITNEQKNYGASTICCSDILKTLADLSGEDLYVVPSSVHELLAIPKSCLPQGCDYTELIKSVNLEYLDPDEVLSETLYYYDSQEDELKIYTKVSSIG